MGGPERCAATIASEATGVPAHTRDTTNLVSTESDLRIKAGDGTGTYILSGEIDMDTASQIAEIPVPTNGLPATLTLDFSGVTFLDSIGIWALLNLAAGLGNGKLVVAHATGPVRRILDMVDMPDIGGILIED